MVGFVVMCIVIGFMWGFVQGFVRRNREIQEQYKKEQEAKKHQEFANLIMK